MKSRFDEGIGVNKRNRGSEFAVLEKDLDPGIVPNPDYFMIMVR